jgi:hypothetical protein
MRDRIWVTYNVSSGLYPRAGHGMTSVNTNLYVSGGFVSCDGFCQSNATLFEASDSEFFSFCSTSFDARS